MLLKFLYDHLAYSQDLHCRVKWAPKTVVVWDNRVTAHSALIDWDNGSRRRKSSPAWRCKWSRTGADNVFGRHRSDNAPG
jgi:hypothetical protein